MGGKYRLYKMKGTTDEQRAEPFIGGFALGWDDHQRSPLTYSIKIRMEQAVEVCRWKSRSVACINPAKGWLNSDKDLITYQLLADGIRGAYGQIPSDFQEEVRRDSLYPS